MARNRTIYSSDRLEALLGDRILGPRDATGAITRMCDRYVECIRRILPRIDLTLTEWSLIIDSCNSWADPSPQYLRQQVSDSITLDRLDDKWQVDGELLIQRLSKLEYVELMCLVDVIERFWASGQKLCSDTLKKLGIISSE